jgi:hypothetical protein
MVLCWAGLLKSNASAAARRFRQEETYVEYRLFRHENFCFLGATPGRKAPFQREETKLPTRGIMRAVQRAKTGCTLVPLCPLRSLVPAMGGLIIGGVDPV